MNKNYFTLLTAFILGLFNYAQAQYVHTNPISFKVNKETINVSIGAADMLLNYLPEDTVMDLSSINLYAHISTYNYVEPKEGEDSVFCRIYEFLNTYYDQIYNNYEFELQKKDFAHAAYSKSIKIIKNNTISPDRAGVYKWGYGVASRPELSAHGTIQFNRDPTVVFGSKGPNKDASIYNTQKFSIDATVYSGYPYDVKKYQGNCRVKVFDPDSIMISDFDVLMEASNDSVKLEYQKEIDICVVDSAKEGTYVVEIYPCWQTGIERYAVSVIDPLKDASTGSPADATYRFRNMTFNENEMGVWKNTGKPVTVVNTKEGNAIIINKENKDDDDSFNISQTVAKMPKGWYGLKWNGYYQPGMLDSIKVADPILAKIYGCSTEKNLNHVFDTFRGSYSSNYYDISIPYTNEAIASELSKNRYTLNTLEFEVGEDSIVIIGAKASTSKHIGALTALGSISLEFYGKGLPYGIVSFGEEKYNPEDSIKVDIKLFDGPGMTIPTDNKIVVAICAGLEFDENKIIDIKEIDAPKKGDYHYEMIVPKSDDFYNGTYTIFITSINVDGTYLLKESQTIELSGGKDATSIANTSVSEAKVNTGVAYDVSGRVVDAKTAKGIIIIDGKKNIR